MNRKHKSANTHAAARRLRATNPCTGRYSALDTFTTAHYLSWRPQTLRWPCHRDGPLRPLRVDGRLAWKAANLRGLLEVAE